MNIFDGLAAAARSSVQGAIEILIIITAFGLIVGGMKGGKWVLRTAFSPIKAIFEKKITAILYICAFVIASYFLGHLITAPFTSK